MYSLHGAHSLVVSKKKTKSQTMISSMWNCQMMLIWTFLSKMVGFPLRNPVLTASLLLVSGQCCVRGLENMGFSIFAQLFMIKQEQWKERWELSSYIKLSSGSKNLFTQKSLLKNVYRLKTRPRQTFRTQRQFLPGVGQNQSTVPTQIWPLNPYWFNS